MKTGDRVVWYTYKRDADYNFVAHDAVILSVREGWNVVEIEYVDRDDLLRSKKVRKVPGDRLMPRVYFVKGLDDDVPGRSYG